MRVMVITRERGLVFPKRQGCLREIDRGSPFAAQQVRSSFESQTGKIPGTAETGRLTAETVKAAPPYGKLLRDIKPFLFSIAVCRVR